MSVDAIQIADEVVESPNPEPQMRGWAQILWGVVVPGIAIGAGILMFAPLKPEAIGALGLTMMLSMMIMKVPLGFTMAVPGALGTWAIIGTPAMEGMLRRMPLDSTANWSLAVLPMFVFMGLLLWRSGLTEHIYYVVGLWMNRLPGGLAIGTWTAGAGLASLSGSTLGTLFPLARAGMPEMLRAGYDKRLALAAVASAGTMAHLIPPGLFLIIYAGVVSVPVGPQLMAGLIPGLLIALMYCVAIFAIGILRPSMVGGSERPPRVSWGTKIKALGKIWDAPVLIVVIVGGIYGGYVTATEGGALGALGALLICVVRRRSQAARAIWEAAVSTVSAVGAIFLLLIGANMVARLFSVSGLGDGFAGAVLDLDMGRVTFLLTMAVVYIVLGTFMDPLPMMLLTVPVIMPVFDELGISLIWFGVFLVVFQELAVLSPPVGVLSYVLHGIVQDPEVNLGQKITIGDVMIAVLYVIPVALLLVGVIIAFPDIVTWLPDRMSQ